MKRLQISLEVELDEQLGEVARRDGISKAEVVRRSLEREIRPRSALEEDPLLKMFGTLSDEGKGLSPGESIDDVLYGRKGHGDIR